MEGRDERDPGYDDWFDEPEPPTETQSAVSRGTYEDAEDVWVFPEEDGDRGQRRREIVVGGRTLTTTQAAIIVVSVLAIFFAILAAFGVFNGKTATLPPVTSPPPTTTTQQTTTQATTTTQTLEVPAQALNPGDQGSQVKILQRDLIKLGYLQGPPDGDYGPATQNAVEKFQLAKQLSVDGRVGEETLSALSKALSG